MLVYRQLGMVEEPFKVLNYRVIEDKTPQGVSVSQATVKLQIGDKISHQVSEGDGPVNALDAALRKALLPFFPNMAKVKLDDYKVRVSWMAFVDGLTYKILVDNKVIENAYKHLDVNPVAPAKAKEEPAPTKSKNLTARKVRNLAGVSRKK